MVKLHEFGTVHCWVYQFTTLGLAHSTIKQREHVQETGWLKLDSAEFHWRFLRPGTRRRFWNGCSGGRPDLGSDLLALVGSFKYLPVIKHGHNTYPIDGFSQLETSRTRAGISHRHGRDDTRGYILRLNDPITEVSLRAVNSTDGAIRRGDHLMVDSQVHLPSRPPKVVRKQTPKTDFPAMFFRGVIMAIVGSHS